MKITIPISSAKNGGSLYVLVDDLTNTNSGISKNTLGDNLIIEDNPDIPIKMDQTTLLQILGEGGEVEDHLMAIKVPISLANTIIPVGVPYRENVIGNARTFSEWFLYGAQVWIDAPGGFFIFYTNPLGSASAQGSYLKGSHMSLIRDLNPVTIEILSTEEATIQIEDPANNYQSVAW